MSFMIVNNILIRYYEDGLTNIAISDSVTSIATGAFSVCSSLKSVTIPESVTSIGKYAFSGCSNLTSVTIPSGVTSIAAGVFYNCSSLTSVTIPDSVTSIGSSPFGGCSSLTSVTIPDSVTSIGDYAFEDCNSLTSVTISDSVIRIGEGAFLGCKGLTSKEKYYKAFKFNRGKLRCQDCEFTLGEWSEPIKNIALCKRGYHFCTNLFEIFNYYSGVLDENIIICECEVGDEVIKNDTSKCVTNTIRPFKRICRADVIRLLNGC